MDSIEFLNQALENYRRMVNLNMGLSENPTVNTEVKYEERSSQLLLPEGEKEYRVGVMEVVIDGIVAIEMKKLLKDEETIEDIKYDLADEIITGIFTLGIQILKQRKVNDFIKSLKVLPVTLDECLRKETLMN